MNILEYLGVILLGVTVGLALLYTMDLPPFGLGSDDDDDFGDEVPT